jgi:3-oxoacyl-[acyl-carrier-protein] synthase II
VNRKVAITGIGLVTPIGHTIKQFWENLKNGKSGVADVTKFDCSMLPSRMAAEIKDFNPAEFIEKKMVRRMDSSQQYGLAAAAKAINDGKLDLKAIDLDRAGVIIGSGIGGLETFEKQHIIVVNESPLKVSPFFIPMMIADMASGMTSINFGFRGPNYATVSACASSSHAIADAMMMIQRNAADVMLTGGVEASVTLTSFAGFCAAKALSERNSEPDKASRPFDRDRDGFVIGEGGVILLLEELEHAKRRNAEIYGLILGIGMSADAHHMTAPAPNGEGAARSMQSAIRDAGVNPELIDYINAHGTATLLGDVAETLAIKSVFGDRAYKIPINSTKSMVGHLLGAAGAVELAATLLQMKNGYLHPTINLENSDPQCDLDYVPNKGREAKIKFAISNSFGFGGHNISLLVQQYSGLN